MEWRASKTIMRRYASSRYLAPVLALAAAAILGAQGGPPPDPGAPDRGVARISFVGGEVNVRRSDSGDWVAAVVNVPLMAEDRLATGAGARAEVQFDAANLIRVGANAEIRIAELGLNHYHLQIAHGTVTFRVLRDSPARVELDTPNVSVRPVEAGAYRVYVQADGQSEITVRLGTADIANPRGMQRLQAGQTMLTRGSVDDPEFRIVQAIAMDEWDQWNEERDRQLLNSPSYSYVPQDVPGGADLDNNGQWVDAPSYGEVWAPNVPPDWAPYQNGRWAWEDYYGWTWISYDPWGWAPFHYGRWFYMAPYGWCWYPGGFGPHYWSPAQVAFFGFGPGVGVGFGFGFGSVGWVALAPFEPLYAWWGHGFYAGFRNPAFFNHGMNISNVNITNTYRNSRVANGISAVSAADFRQGRFGAISRTTGAQIRQASLVRGQLPVAPTAASLRYSNRLVTNTPRSSENARFFGHTARPVQRVPFAEQQRAMQQFSRQPAASTMARGAAPGAGGSWRPISPGATANRPATTGGWRPANEPAAAAPPSARPGGYAPDRSSSGWQRFGEPRPAYTPRPSYAPGAYGSYASPANRNPQSIRVAPPIVREKTSTTSGSRTSAPRPSGGHSSGGGSHGGGSHGGGGGHR